MFGRFTERARQVIVLAQDEARALRHHYLGTEHLLLGLLRVEDGVAARALKSLEVSADQVRSEVARIIGQGEEATGQIPFTPRAKKVLELAQREALSLGDNHIGTEHILLGIADENDGVAARILHGSGVHPESVRDAVGQALGIHIPAGRALLRFRPVPRPPGGRVKIVLGSEPWHGRIRWWLLKSSLPIVGVLVLGLGVLIGWLIWG